MSETARAEVANPERVEAGLALIYETAGNVTKAMDEIVWAVNPAHDTFSSLVYYLEKFALDLLRAADLRCRLNFPGDYPQWRPGSEVRHNLFLAYKEALNNAVRHAHATTVTITLAISDLGCTLTVADDGSGPGHGDGGKERVGRIATGNGLANMRRRMERVGGRCDFRITNAGCAVSFFIPSNAPGCSGRTTISAQAS